MAGKHKNITAYCHEANTGTKTDDTKKLEQIFEESSYRMFWVRVHIAGRVT
jgi:hypothetical protein